MNVFVLCTGRCGSHTFIEACKHITNYSAAHESRTGLLGPERLNYPPNHIEADNRLSWFLGRLERAYGDHAIYIHLRRNELDTAASYARRWKYKFCIMGPYSSVILLRSSPKNAPIDVCLDYCDTVNSNIEAFLKNKSKKMAFSLENAKDDFRRFWEFIGAEGDLSAALTEWGKHYSPSKVEVPPVPKVKRPLVLRIPHKLKRIIKKFPSFIKRA